MRKIIVPSTKKAREKQSLADPVHYVPRTLGTISSPDTIQGFSTSKASAVSMTSPTLAEYPVEMLSLSSIQLTFSETLGLLHEIRQFLLNWASVSEL